MFERDYIDVDRFVCDYDAMNYDPNENQEIEYEITEDGDYWIDDDGYGDEDDQDVLDESW